MDARRARRLLLAALILSLLLHGILALSVRWRVTPPRPPDQKITIARRDIIHVTTRLPVTPPPSPVPATPRPAQERRPVVPQKLPALGPGHGQVRPIAARTSQPARTAAPAPCAKTDQPAALAVKPPDPEIPVEARARGVSGTASINVKLDERGAIVDLAIGESSGDASLDQIALTMAKFAQYTPASHLCKALASTYAFKVRFAAW